MRPLKFKEAGYADAAEHPPAVFTDEQTNTETVRQRITEDERRCKIVDLETVRHSPR